MAGVSTSIPAVSPSHHVLQAGPNIGAGRIPDSHKLVAPQVLAKAHDAQAVITNDSTSRARSNGLGVETKRRTKSQATRCSSVFPAQITLAAANPAAVWGSVSKFAKKAPTAIPGQTRQP